MGRGRRGQGPEGSAEAGVQGGVEMLFRVSGLQIPRRKEGLTSHKRKYLRFKIQM